MSANGKTKTGAPPKAPVAVAAAASGAATGAPDDATTARLSMPENNGKKVTKPTVATQQNAGDDFNEGKATLPLLLAVARTRGREEAFWERTVTKGERTPEDFTRARELEHAGGAKLGSVFIYILVGSIGMQMELDKQLR